MGLIVSDIQRFCMHDGEGLRTTVFLKGCPLKCKWCHNPETQSNKSQLLFYRQKCIDCGECAVCPQGAHYFADGHTLSREKCINCGKCAAVCPTGALETVGVEKSIDEIEAEALRDIAFYGEKGGVTISGGEPMQQFEGLTELLGRLKSKGVNTCVETCGYFDKKHLDDIVKYTDMFLWDIKLTDNKIHKEYTGVESRRIIENLLLADSLGAKTLLRCIIVKGVNDNADHYKGIADIFGRLNNCVGVELIPYHTYGGSKSMALNGIDNGNADWIPDKEDILNAKTVLQGLGVKLK